MSREWYDWQAALSDDPAHAYAHGAETALDEATEAAGRDGQTLALVGIGYALLSLRSTVARTGDDAADQLSGMADDVRDLTATLAAALPAPRVAGGRRWRRALAALVGARRPDVEGDDEGQAAAEERGGEDGAERPPLSLVVGTEGER